jgi:hypothetical protein
MLRFTNPKSLGATFDEAPTMAAVRNSIAECCFVIQFGFALLRSQTQTGPNDILTGIASQGPWKKIWKKNLRVSIDALNVSYVPVVAT